MTEDAMGSTIREIYFTNITDGHNKDYRITWNIDMHQVAISWGKIGGSKQGGTEVFTSYSEAAEFVVEKMNRRFEHDYVLVSDTTSPPAVETVGALVGKHEFDADIREMQRIS
jgi:predicted DNA-binding WGR domain protein